MTLRLAQVAMRRELGRPAENAHAHWVSREAQVLTLESESGQRGSGEATPLPGFSPDTLEACGAALASLDLSDIPEQLEAEHSLLTELARASRRLPSALPAARSALEAALLDLWARARGVPAWALLRGDPTPPRPRRVAALLMGEPEHALEQARAAHARGITAFKLKAGRKGALEREVRAFAGLRAALGPDADLRLDANRAWPASTAHQYVQRFAPYAPEYVEEPCALASLTGLAPWPVPLALDESLLEMTPDDGLVGALARGGVAALILKPTLLGGISVCARWARVARQCAADVVLSHTFEGPLGLGLCANLALAYGSDRRAHGLDLAGARLEPALVPYFVGAEIQPCSRPGLGTEELCW